MMAETCRRSPSMPINHRFSIFSPLVVDMQRRYFWELKPHGSAKKINTRGSFQQYDRINTSGELVERDDAVRKEEATVSSSGYVIGSPVVDSEGRTKSTVPTAPPPKTSDVESIVNFIQETSSGMQRMSLREKKSCIVVTGAGISTESGIPDYRSPSGAYSTGFKPMTHQQFMASEENRSRYWARSYAGWEKFSNVKPACAHEALARLQNIGYINHIITQNVDRLHHKAGSDARRVLELHGTTHRVVCMDCQSFYPRALVQEWLSELNPEAAQAVKSIIYPKEEENDRLLRAGTAVPLGPSLREEKQEQLIQNPDGDVELSEQASQSFKVPHCPACGSKVLKPDVVFFGDSLPTERTDLSMKLASNASGVLVVGSSLAVWSAFRLIKAAKERGAKVAVINVGETRADAITDLKVHAIAGEILTSVARSPRLLIPNISA